MSSHRAYRNVSVLPRRFDWHRGMPDLLNVIAIIVGATFALMIVLWLLVGVLPNVMLMALLSSLAWALSSLAFIWLKEHEHHE